MDNPFDAPPGTLADGIDNPQKDIPRLKPKDLMLDAMFGRMFAEFDARKRFDPFYLDSDTNAGLGAYSGPVDDAQVTATFDRAIGGAAPAMSGEMGEATAAAPTDTPNPFDVQDGSGGMPVTPPDQRMPPQGPDRAGDFSPNLDPYGEDMREALRRIVRNS